MFFRFAERTTFNRARNQTRSHGWPLSEKLTGIAGRDWMISSWRQRECRSFWKSAWHSLSSLVSSGGH